jgi:hypothetical protein
MHEPGCRENYPLRTVVAANLVSLLVYGIGAYILFRSGLIWAVVYLIFAGIFELRLISGHCPDCYYYGKTCAFGKGRLSALLFSKGSPERFAALQLSWKDLVPDFLLFMIPVLAGILLLVQVFDGTILILVIVLLLLGFAGNALVRGQLACKYCRQREIGCPALQLFEKKEKP